MSESTPSSDNEAKRQLAAAVGEFDPPGDFDHGDEFRPERPRPIPAKLRQGSYPTKRRGAVWTLLILGAACVAFHYVKMVQELAYYILVLKYLNYIGFALLGIAAVTFLVQRLDPGRFAYIRDGIPIVGKVLSIGSHVQGDAQFQTFKYLVNVAYRDPDAGQLRTTQIETEEAWPENKRPAIDIALDEGQYVTLVGLPGSFHQSLRVYGLLGLDPEREFLLKNGRPMRGMSSLTALLIAVTVCCGLALLMSAIYAIEFCFPKEGDWTVAILPGGLGALAGLAGGWSLVRLERKNNPASTPTEQGCLLVGGPFLGILAGVVAMALLNAKLDRSPPEYRSIELVEFWEETWTPIFIRNYKIEYREFDREQTEKIPAQKEHMDRFQGVFGVIEVGQGRFGWTWIRGIHPLVWERKELQEAPHEGDPGLHADGRYVFLQHEDPVTKETTMMLFRPRIRLPDDTLIAPPPALEERALEALRREVLVDDAAGEGT